MRGSLLSAVAERKTCKNSIKVVEKSSTKPPSKEKITKKSTSSMEVTSGVHDNIESNKKSESNQQEKMKEIDDLFTTLKTSKIDKKKKDEEIIEEEIRLKKKEKLKKNSLKPKKFIISPEAPIERVDAESGFKVYKAHLLKVGEGGGTPLCPFDCDCCF